MNIDKEPILHAKEIAEMGDQEKEKSLNNQGKRTRRMWSTPCIMCVQYIRGCSVHRGDIMSTSGGYHEYIGGCSVHRGMFSTSGDVQYIGGIS